MQLDVQPRYTLALQKIEDLVNSNFIFIGTTRTSKQWQYYIVKKAEKKQKNIVKHSPIGQIESERKKEHTGF